MRVANDNLLQLDGAAVSGDLSVSQQFKPFFLGHIVNFSLQLVISGTPNGYFSLQASNDIGTPNASRESQQFNGVQNWTEVTGYRVTVTQAGTVTMEYVDAGFEWVRLVWIAQGVGTTPVLQSARIKVKGI